MYVPWFCSHRHIHHNDDDDDDDDDDDQDDDIWWVWSETLRIRQYGIDIEPSASKSSPRSFKYVANTFFTAGI